MNLPQGVDLSTPPDQWQGASGPVGMAPAFRPSSFVQDQRLGQTQPVPPLVQRLINDPTVDNSILAEAYRNVYGVDLPGVAA
jgi:hypothetical protein